MEVNKIKLTLAVSLLVFVSMFASARAEALVKIKFVNKTDRKISVATLIYVTDERAKGWYNIEPGKSKTLTFDVPLHIVEDIGYYAKASKNGKTVHWKGDRHSEFHNQLKKAQGIKNHKKV